MREWALALLKIKPQPNPAEFASAFFVPVNTLFFQNLRQEESRKSVLHALIERIQAYPDRKVEVKFRIGEKTEETGGGKTLPPPVDIPRRVNTPRAGCFQLHSHLAVCSAFD